MTVPISVAMIPLWVASCFVMVAVTRAALQVNTYVTSAVRKLILQFLSWFPRLSVNPLFGH